LINSNSSSPQFLAGANVISIVHHPPEVMPGTPAKIVKPRIGTLCAVQLPDGEIHSWFASFEMSPLNPQGTLTPGSQAKIIDTTGHPSHIQEGTVVRIVRCFPRAIFYDVMLEGEKYHRWLAEFELAIPI
jgi:hypothetical protein